MNKEVFKIYMYMICNKCNTVIRKSVVKYHYEMNNKNYIMLEFVCKCKNIVTYSLLLEEYNKYIVKKYYS
jgi:hypothetical protein